MATFELFRDSSGMWHWHLRHQNGEILARAGQGCRSKRAALYGIQSLMEVAEDAKVVEMSSEKVAVVAGAPCSSRKIH